MATKIFSMKHILSDFEEEFSEETAPKWLKEGGIENSTMCNRWFWKKHIMVLNVSESIETDFHVITRLS